MTANISSVNDFQGLAQLRHDASVPSQETAREAARQFEALFVQMMLKSMRDANAVLGESQDTTYQEMFDQQIAMEMTRGKGLGIAEMMSRQLGDHTGAARRQRDCFDGHIDPGAPEPHSGPAQRCRIRLWRTAGTRTQ